MLSASRSETFEHPHRSTEEAVKSLVFTIEHREGLGAASAQNPPARGSFQPR